MAHSFLKWANLGLGKSDSGGKYEKKMVQECICVCLANYVALRLLEI